MSIEQAAVATVTNYNHNIFIVQATEFAKNEKIHPKKRSSLPFLLSVVKKPSCLWPIVSKLFFVQSTILSDEQSVCPRQTFTSKFNICE